MLKTMGVGSDALARYTLCIFGISWKDGMADVVLFVLVDPA